VRVDDAAPPQQQFSSRAEPARDKVAWNVSVMNRRGWHAETQLRLTRRRLDSPDLAGIICQRRADAPRLQANRHQKGQHRGCMRAERKRKAGGVAAADPSRPAKASTSPSSNAQRLRSGSEQSDKRSPTCRRRDTSESGELSGRSSAGRGEKEDQPARDRGRTQKSKLSRPGRARRANRPAVTPVVFTQVKNNPSWRAFPREHRSVTGMGVEVQVGA